MYSEFTPTCTLKAESFGHLISTEKKIIRFTDGVTNNDNLKDEFKKKIKLT